MIDRDGIAGAASRVISIVVCTFNRAEQLRVALHSLLRVKHPGGWDCEIVVVDDGSTDHTGAIVAAMPPHATALRYLRQDNAGVAAARNAGVGIAAGEWIAFFDDDQIADESWLQNLMRTANASGADCIGGPCALIVPAGLEQVATGTVRALLGENRHMFETRRSLLSRLDPRRSRNAMPGTGNVLVRRRLFESSGLFRRDIRYGEDLEFFRRAQAAGATFAVSSDALVHHLLPPDRFEAGYLARLADLGGRSQAEIDRGARGLAHTIAMAALRSVHLIVWTLPRLFASFIGSGATRRLGYSCSLTFSRAYIGAVSRDCRRACRGIRPAIDGTDGHDARTPDTRFPGACALADQAVISAANFATGVIVGRYAGVYELGLYSMAVAAIAFATDISVSLITTPYTVLGPELAGTARRRYAASLVVHQVALSMLFAVLIVAGALVIALTYGNGAVGVAWTLAAMIVFINLRDCLRRMAFGDLSTGTALVLDTGVCIVQIAGVWLLAASGRVNASSVFVVVGLVSAGAVAMWVAVRGLARPGSAGAIADDFRRNWTLGRWVLGSGILWGIAMYLYPWLLAAYHSAAVTGAWAAAFAVVAVGNPLLLGVGNYAGADLANAYAAFGAAALRRRVRLWSIRLGALMAPLTVATVLVGDRLVVALYGNAYASNGLVVGLLGVNLLLVAITLPVSKGLVAMRRAEADTLANVLAVATLLAIGVSAVKFHGTLGAALALLASTAVASIARTVAFRREPDRAAVRYLIEGKPAARG